MSLPAFEGEDLPTGIHRTTLRETLDRFGDQTHFRASVFWLRRAAALGGEEAAIGHWQVKRDGTRRGVIEIVGESP